MGSNTKRSKASHSLRLHLRAVSFAVTLSLLALPSALAQSGGGAQFDGRWWANPQIAERLGLTPDQVESIDEITLSTGEEMIDLRAEREKAQLVLARLLDAETLDEEQLEQALLRMQRAECEIHSLESRSRIEIAKLLDKEQRTRLMRRFEQQRRAPSRQRRGTRPGTSPPSPPRD